MYECKSRRVGLILAGGRGTRLSRILHGTPKPLAIVNSRPFIEWIIRYLRKQKILEIVLSAGYLSEQIVDYSKNFSLDNVSISHLVEDEPLGTGGAIRNAILHLECKYDTVIVTNGDSLALIDLNNFLEQFESDACEVGIVATKVDDASRFGSLIIGVDGELLSFQEKYSSSGIINAGIYFIKPSAIKYFPNSIPLSLETDVFPALLSMGLKIKVYQSYTDFIDIGTESSFMMSESFIKKNMHLF